MIFNFTSKHKLHAYSYILFICLLSSAFAITPLFPSENDSLLKKCISQPYSTLFSNIMNNVEYTFQDMKAYVEKQLTNSGYEQEDEKIIYIVDDFINEDKISFEDYQEEDNYNYDYDDSDSDRNLAQLPITIPSGIQVTIPTGVTNLVNNLTNTTNTIPLTQVSTLKKGSCFNTGKEILVNVTVYTCNKTEVSKKKYEVLKATQNCTVAKNRNKRLCYCSYDYYGNRCEFRNWYTCELEFLGPLNNCQGKDSFDYVYKYSGTPPCNKVETGQNVSIQ